MRHAQVLLQHTLGKQNSTADCPRSWPPSAFLSNKTLLEFHLYSNELQLDVNAGVVLKPLCWVVNLHGDRVTE